MILALNVGSASSKFALHADQPGRRASTACVAN